MRQVDIDFAEMNAFRMLVEFGAAGPAADRYDFGHFREQSLGDEAEPVRLGQRDARIELHGQNESALVEGRKKAARQKVTENRGDQDGDRNQSDHQSAAIERPLKRAR